MSFRVVWPSAAKNALAQAFLEAKARGDAASVTEAAHLVDQMLAANPADVGEAREGDERVMFLPSVVVYFEVFDEEQVAVVTRVYYRP